MAKSKRRGHVVLPENRKILRALELTPPHKVKVVIVGQDPYPTRGHACGLCFSVEPEVSPLPKSLINIFRELKDDVGRVSPNGDLSHWAKQGVLLLNTTLTVFEGQRNSNRGIGWEILSTDVIRYLSENRQGIVYILWGKPAQAKAMYINPYENKVIKAAHPSPLSAHRGFFGSKPFSKTDKYLIERGEDPIEW